MTQSRWPREAWLPLLTGLAWFWCGASEGFGAFVLTALPGALLTTTGAAMLLWPGDRSTAQFTAAGAALGVLLSVPAIFAIGLLPALLLCVSSVACFLSAGMFSIHSHDPADGVPNPKPDLKLAALTAIDEAILAEMSFWTNFPTGDDATRVTAEVHTARDQFRERGWLEKPATYHPAPMPLEAPTLRAGRTRGIDFEHLSFESEYSPHPDEPGRERWLSLTANRVAHAWVLRHAEEGRPWVVCIHGFRMGSPLIDLSAFDPRFFRDKLGFNMLVPVLPLHGPRKCGRRSGDGYLDGDVLDTVHAQAQAAWDLRRLLSWLRAEGASAIGVYGLSLGGYNTALLASLDGDLECAIAGIPATDFSGIFWHHGPQAQLRAFEARGLEREHAAEAFRVVSPLAMDPLVAPEGRAIFGGVTDRIVPPEQVQSLVDHWGKPVTIWYQGGHLSFDSDRRVKRCLETTLRERLT